MPKWNSSIEDHDSYIIVKGSRISESPSQKPVLFHTLHRNLVIQKRVPQCAVVNVSLNILLVQLVQEVLISDALITSALLPLFLAKVYTLFHRLRVKLIVNVVLLRLTVLVVLLEQFFVVLEQAVHLVVDFRLSPRDPLLYLLLYHIPDDLLVLL